MPCSYSIGAALHANRRALMPACRASPTHRRQRRALSLTGGAVLVGGLIRSLAAEVTAEIRFLHGSPPSGGISTIVNAGHRPTALARCAHVLPAAALLSDPVLVGGLIRSLAVKVTAEIRFLRGSPLSSGISKQRGQLPRPATQRATPRRATRYSARHPRPPAMPVLDRRPCLSSIAGHARHR